LVVRAFVISVTLVLLVACRDRDNDPPDSSTTVSPTIGAPESPSPDATSPAPATETPASAPVPTAQAGVYEFTEEFGGEDRTWRVYVPASLPAGVRVPLVIGLHGGLGSGEQFARNTRFDEAADGGAFIAVYPDGVGRTWNGGRCCGAAVRQDIDDVAFISALIDRMTTGFPADPARVYVTGHSNGGIMAFRLACELAGKITAIGVVAASLETGECSPARPVSVLLIHGDADENHPLEGGQGPESISGVDFTSVADTMAVVSGGMGCSSATGSETAGDLETTLWLGCPDGTAVAQVIVAGASHAWPGGTGGVLGPASQAIDATEVIAGFFAGGLTGAR
jgi:polyhydroxybutyrate depolymerase